MKYASPDLSSRAKIMQPFSSLMNETYCSFIRSENEEQSDGNLSALLGVVWCSMLFCLVITHKPCVSGWRVLREKRP